MTAQAKPEVSDAPALVVFGRDDKGKPHASSFTAAEADLATKAAGLMGMHALPVSTDELRELATKLPKGRVFGSGRAFVPFVKAAQHDRLAALHKAAGGPEVAWGGPGDLEAEKPPEGAAKAGEGEVGSGQRSAADLFMPRTWADIGIGSLVLMSTGHMDGWFEAVVVEANGDDLFTLEWRDWPDEPTLVRQRLHLGLLNPDGGAQT